MGAALATHGSGVDAVVLVGEHRAFRRIGATPSFGDLHRPSRPPGGDQATYTWLSGMSPAALTSGAFGLAATAPLPAAAVLADGVEPLELDPHATAGTSDECGEQGRGGETSCRHGSVFRIEGSGPVGTVGTGRSPPDPDGGQPTAKLSRSPIGSDDGALRVRSVTAHSLVVIEDDEAIGRGLETALSGQGYDVSWRRNGADGIAAAQDTTVELVLLDLGLPDMDGIEVCRRLRASRPDLVVVMLTARTQEMDVVAGLDAGADDYLTKPFRLAELLARVRAHLRRPRASSGPGRARAGAGAGR